MPKERLLHHVIISVFCKAYERKEEVLAGLDLLSPKPTAELLALEKEYDPERPHTIHYRAKDITLTVQETESDDGTMTIYTLFFRGLHDTSVFAKRMRDVLPERSDPLSFLDEEGRIVLRFGKRDLMRGKLVLSPTGDCYLAKSTVAAYPKTPERIEAVARRILG
jgi:RNA binding exosome subunit